MGKLANVSTRDAVKVFTKVGFIPISQKGSHLKMRRTTADGRTQTIIIPRHRTLKLGTLKNGILKPISISPEEFIRLLKR